MAAAAVQQILERMVPELEDLQEKGIFTPAEVKAIVARRRDHEYALHRRAPVEDDFVRAIEYELNLEALRRRRKDKLGLRRSTLADHAGVRRIHFIFDRAARRLRADARWWLQWADFSIRTRSARAADRIFGRALQLHPRDEALWALAAAWHFDRMANFATARSLMTRAVRVNRYSKALWLAFFRLECVYVLRMKGRRFALGLDVGRRAADAPLAAAQLDAALGDGGEDGESGDDGDGAGGGGGAADYDVGGADGADDDGATDGVTAAAGDDGGDGDTAAAAAVLPQPLPTPDAAGGAGGTDADARAAFFAGAVPRLIFNQAVALLPTDVQLRLDFLRVADSMHDVLAAEGAAGAAAGAIAPPPPPAFPDLAAHILASIAADFPADAATWRALALRPLAPLLAATAGSPVLRSLGGGKRARSTGDGGGEAAAAAVDDDDGDGAAAPAAPALPPAAASLADDALFAIDSHGGGGGGGGGGSGGRAAADALTAVPASRVGVAGTRRPAAPPARTPFHPTAALQSWLRDLADGAVGAAFAADAATSGGSKEDADAGLALPLSDALWTATVTPADGAGGRKRKRGSAAVADDGAAPSLSVSLAAATVAPEGANGAELERWAAEAQDAALDVAATAMAASPSPRTAAAVASVLLPLLRLPLAPTAAEAARRVRLLRRLAALCADGAAATLTGDEAGDADARLALLRLRVESLLRLGRVGDAVAAVAAAVASAAGGGGSAALNPAAATAVAGSALAFASLALAIAPAAPLCASATAAASTVGLVPGPAAADAGDGAVPSPAGLLAWPAAPAWGADGAPLPAAARTLDAALRRLPSTLPATARVWGARVAVAWAPPPPGGRVPALCDALDAGAAVVERCVRSRPSPALVAPVALAHIGRVSAAAAAAAAARAPPAGLTEAECVAVRRALRAAAPPAAPPEVHLAAIDAVRALAGTDGGGAGARDWVRRAFEAAVAAHGASAPELWAAFVAFERDALLRPQACGPAGLRAPAVRDAGSDVYARAVTALSASPAGTARFLQALRSPGGV